MPEEILKLDESCISNPKSEIADWTGAPETVQFAISDFGFEMQDSSNFKILSQPSYCRTFSPAFQSLTYSSPSVVT